MSIELRLGDYRTALADVESVDCLISDPPYSERTHSGQRHGRRDEICAGKYVSARGLDYEHWSPDDVREFVSAWHPRCAGWMVAFTDSELYPAWRDTLRETGRTVFAPIPCVQVGMNVRLAGDGPSNWCVWIVVARPPALHRWGTLRGAYYGNPFDVGENTAKAGRRSSVVGSKPLWLMRQVVSDYSRPGDLVVDPTAGGGTTLLAAALEGRNAIGSEMRPEAYAIAQARISHMPVEQRGQLPIFTGDT